MSENPLVLAWRTAADDLGIDVIAPFSLDPGEGDLVCVALVRSFGAESGMLVLDGRAEEWNAVRPALETAGQHGYGYSFLRDGYAAYDRDLFVATLNDWGWMGVPDAAPPWYTGEPWS